MRCTRCLLDLAANDGRCQGTDLLHQSPIVAAPEVDPGVRVDVSVGSLLERVGRLAANAPELPLDVPERPVEDRGDAQWRRLIPPVFHGARLVDVVEAHGQAVCAPLVRWAEHPAGNVVLAGPAGVGKSYAAVALLRSAGKRQGRTYAFLPTSTFLRRVSPGAEHPEAAMAGACGVDILVLDDLGAERSTEWAVEQVYELVNQRWLHQRLTVATANTDNLEGVVGERLYSRLVDGAVGVRLGGADRRRG